MVSASSRACPSLPAGLRRVRRRPRSWQENEAPLAAWYSLRCEESSARRAGVCVFCLRLGIEDGQGIEKSCVMMARGARLASL